MDDELAKDARKVQADNQGIAIGEINITGTVTGNITIGHTIVQPADSRLRHELGILLKNVQTTWIQGVLEKSVHEAALLELGLELREEAVDNPWRMVIEGPDQRRQTLPRGRRIKDIFDEANRLLLILGEPGSGKTTTLLQLARDLIAEVDSAFTQPVPVILNLSTWTNKAQPLDEWLVAELNSKYRLPKKDGQRWLRERRILPLLDGLDEVRAENRAACVERINQLVTDYGLQGMAVCSRIKDYTALDVRLAFYRAIYIQLLSPEQVDEYLERAGEKLASLRSTLQGDEALRSMAQSPLILNVMSLAYQDTPAEDLTGPTLNSNKARRKHLIDTYISRMFNRKSGPRQYEDEQTRQQLAWLARNMQRHSQEVFLIENLQPSWLSASHWHLVYVFAARFIALLIIGLIFIPIIMGLDTGLIDRLSVGRIWLFIELISMGLIAGLSIVFIDVLRFQWLHRWKGMKESSTIIWSVIHVVFILLIFGPLIGRWPFSVGFAVLFGLLFGILFVLRSSGQNLENDIQTVEALHWFWREAYKGGLIGGITGLAFVLVTGEYSELLDIGLVFVLVGVILKGLRGKIIETKSTPNQGIRLSIKNAILGGLIFALSTVLIFGLRERLSRELNVELEYTGLEYAWMIGLVGALWYGGLDVIHHYTLRLILLIQGHTPANYARFLDYAVDRIFLQKVGGGYRFIHRLLLEHFAEMGETKKV